MAWYDMFIGDGLPLISPQRMLPALDDGLAEVAVTPMRQMPQGLLGPARPSGFTILGATLQDAGAALDGRSGGNLDALAQRQQADAERRARLPDPFEQALGDGAVDSDRLLTALTPFSGQPGGFLSAIARSRYPRDP
jgi:hypothetical protein